MLNYHPMFVHFPLALLIMALVLQAVVVLGRRGRLQTFASGLLYLGALGALPAVLTGWLAGEQVEKLEGFTPAVEATLKFHATMMFIVTGLALLLAALAYIKRAQMTPLIQRVLFVGLLVLVILLGLGADRGGQLVYQYGVGGQKMGAQPPPARP